MNWNGAGANKKRNRSLADPNFPSRAEHQRARFEFIAIELQFAQNRLRAAATAIADQNSIRAKELLDAAKHSLDTVLGQLAKLSPHVDQRSILALAALLAEDIDELREQIS